MSVWGKHISILTRPALVVIAGLSAPGGALADLGTYTLSQRMGLLAAPAGTHYMQLSPLSALLFRGMNLRQWHDLTRVALLPDFAEYLGYRIDTDRGLLDRSLLLPGFLKPLDSPRITRLSFELSASRVPETPFVSTFGSRLIGYADPGRGFERTTFTSGLSRQVGSGAIDVAAVFARQGYATWGFGSTLDRSSDYGVVDPDPSRGSGLRLGISSELAPGLQVGAAYQSRIDMDAFNNYRGVYSEPGDFDIPATANIGIVVKTTARTSLSFDVQRVLYSQVNTFTSSLLPDRFLSLLGDSASPDFNWRDLTVYRVGWNWQSGEDITWRLDYSTSQQPTPTSEALAQALEPEFANRNMSFGFSKRTGRHARLDFAASYADSIYYLGNPGYSRSSDLDGDQFEFEVIWV